MKYEKRVCADCKDYTAHCGDEIPDDCMRCAVKNNTAIKFEPTLKMIDDVMESTNNYVLQFFKETYTRRN